MTRILPPALSVVSALGAFAVLMWVAIGTAGGVFEYPLDDVYIHLAMAEQIAAGGYGVNAGEIASAASSPLYPLLLLPFAGTEVQRVLPLLWNLAGLVAAAWIWGRILIVSGIFEGQRALIGWAAALAGPVALNTFGVAFTGMEHTLHVAASLAIVLGLLRLLEEERLTLPLLAGLFLTTALRLEGMALGLLAAIVVLRVSGLRPALLCAALTILPVALFAGTLIGLGLDPLPESVQAKLQGNDTVEMDLVTRFLAQFQVNIAKPAGFVLLMASGILLAFLFVLPGLRETGPRSVVMAIFLAALAHLLFGQIGWMDRYEGYIWATLAAGLMIAASRGPLVGQGVSLAVIIGGGVFAYWTSWTDHFPWNIRAIHLQPAQSARFAHDYAKVPVAVNDLGLAVWRNPDYVLDLYGLASAEARYLRIEAPTPGWAGPLAEAKGVKLAMIYDKWLGDAVAEDWVLLGYLRIEVPPTAPSIGYLGDDHVSYYATDPAHVDALKAALAEWAPTLPEGAVWDGVE